MQRLSPSLTKPYVLVADPLLAANGPCTMANPNQISFVEAVIFDPTPPNGGKNKLYVYHVRNTIILLARFPPSIYPYLLC
jgi:hypothetical protein